MQHKPLIVSVVRDMAMYEKCIATNPFCRGCEFRAFDNRATHERITVLYNKVLSNLDHDCSRWLVLCHEDFRPMEALIPWLQRADKKNLYGVIGGVLAPKRIWFIGGVWEGITYGQINESEKDGTRVRICGRRASLGTKVETVDCQCLVVHSSLVQKYELRFDENLSFDLYTEDFCLGAYLKHGIKTAILPLKCQHFSRGTILPRFFEQKAYLDRKYPKAEAFGCAGYTIGGGRTVMRRFQKRVRTFLDRHVQFAVEWYFKLMG